MTITKELAPRRFAAALFDLDDCLYRNEAIPQSIRSKIIQYMVEHLKMSPHGVEEKCRALYVEHGTTLAGLVAEGHQVDLQHWHRHVHGSLDYERLLHPDPHLRDLLCSIELPRWVFTNADSAHAEACLERLGISDCFQGIVHFEGIQAMAADASSSTGGNAAANGIVCKPHQHAFELALEHCGLKDPAQVLFFDDSVRNIKSARDLGMFTVLVGSSDASCGADVAVPTLHELRHGLPGLFNNPSLASMDVEAVQHNLIELAAPVS